MVEAGDAHIRPSLRDRIVLVGSSEMSREDREEAACNLHLDSVFAWANVLGTVDDMVVPGGALDVVVLKEGFDNIKPQLTHPEYTDELLSQLQVEIQKQQKTLRLFRKMAGLPEWKKDANDWTNEDRSRVGESIYRYITGKKPKDAVSLIPTPLAVSVFVKNEHDLHRLYGSKKNIGGFFDAKCVSKVQNNAFPRISPFPFIAVFQENALPHELGHARLSVDQTILNRTSMSPLFQIHQMSSERRVISEKKYFAHIVKHWIQTKEPAVYDAMRKKGKITQEVLMRYWIHHADATSLQWLDAYVNERIIPLALSHAKNEILADYKSETRLDYSGNVLKIRGLYNKIGDLFWYVIQGSRKIPKSSESAFGVIDQSAVNAWHRYVEIVDNWHTIAWRLRGDYAEFGLSQRVKYFAHILEQIPCTVPPHSATEDIRRLVNTQFRAFQYERNRARSYEGLLAQHGEMERFLEYLDGKKDSAYGIEIDEFKKRARVFRTKPEDIHQLRELVRQGQEMKMVIQNELEIHQMESLIPIFNTYEYALREWIQESAYLMEGTGSTQRAGKAAKMR